MNNKYYKTNKNSLKGDILITSRTEYINLISKDFLEQKIIPIDYIDKQLYLEHFNKHKQSYLNDETNETKLIINDKLRLDFIIKLLNKEIIKGTAKLITSLCN
jgi:hypothetical protein